MTGSRTVRPTKRGRGNLGDVALALGVAGLLPILPVVGSVAALACGYAAGRGDHRARAAVLIGWIGVLAPVAALVIYCGVLGYPFPIHRYSPGR